MVMIAMFKLNKLLMSLTRIYPKIMSWTIIVYLQVNALSKWIIWIYLHEFSNNERKNFTTENFEFIVIGLVQVNLDNSLADA